MDTTPSPVECAAETRTRPGFLTFLSGHKLHATFLAGALVLAGATTAIASSHQPDLASSVSAMASESPAAAETPAPEPSETPEAPEPAPAVEAAPEPEPAPAPEPEPAPAAEPAPEPAPVDTSLTDNAYTVAPGDTVSSIASRYGVDANAMLSANGLGIYSTIVPGQVLKFTGPPIPVQAPVPAAAPVQAQAPAQQQRQQTYSPAPAAAPAPAPTPAGRMIYLAGSGGQDMVDRCAGPVHFTPIGESMSIAEHDFCGGWARFSGIQVGETVTIAGVGTYTAYARGNVPRGGNMSHVRGVLGGTPPVFLQTCIPGTSEMLVIGLR